MYYTYVLLSHKDKHFYTGFCHDLAIRFKQHQSGKVFSTKHRRPLALIYYEACLNENDAKAREKYLKSGMGKKYLKNRIKRYLKNL